MTNIMEQILTGKLNNLETYSSEIEKFINQRDILELTTILKTVKRDKLYSREIHGLYHSEKVMLFAYLIAKKLNLNPVDFKIIMDAAIYHDIKRENDFEDAFHGYVSAQHIHLVVDDEIYKEKSNLEMLKAIIDIHSQDDKYAENNFYNYDLDEEQYERYKLLYSILKDADALDRTRFVETSMASLNIEFLRLDFSKILISLAKAINLMYYEVIGMNQPEHVVDSSKGGTCIHSIGFDFFKLKSILQHGILSAHEMKSIGLNVPRNFIGGNSNKWISVVDTSLIKYQHTAYKNFTQHGIGFLCEVPEMIEPYPAEQKAEAIRKGEPYNKSGHLDERYVYKKIPIDNIMCVIIPEHYINMDIKNLTYLYNSLDFKLFIERINYYSNIFNQEGVTLFDESYSKEKFETLLANYKRTIDVFIDSKQDKNDRLVVQKELEELLQEINKFIQNAMYKYYSKLTGKTGNITVLDITNYELTKSGVNYKYMHGEVGADAKFIINSYLEKQPQQNIF